MKHTDNTTITATATANNTISVILSFV